MQHVPRDERIKLLRGVWLFERCTKKELAVLARMATSVVVEPGRMLAREGAPGHEFVVVEGRPVGASTTARRHRRVPGVTDEASGVPPGGREGPRSRPGVSRA